MMSKTMKIILFVVSVFLLVDAFTNVFDDLILVKKVFAVVVTAISLVIAYFALSSKNKN